MIRSVLKLSSHINFEESKYEVMARKIYLFLVYVLFCID